MIVSVARRYQFPGRHHVPGLPKPWCEPHDHLYTVEIVAEAQGMLGIVLDTDKLDELWAELAPQVIDVDLNSLYGDTTVEGLSTMWLRDFREEFKEVVEVTVWEDDSRWGRARI